MRASRMNPGVSSRGSPTPKSISSRPSAAAFAARRSSSSKGYGATPRIPGERWMPVISLVSSVRSSERTARHLGETERRTVGGSIAPQSSTKLEGIGNAVVHVSHRTLEQDPPVIASLESERTPAEGHDGRGRDQPGLVGRDRDRAGPGPACERLADAALPYANANVAVRDPNELDVGPLGEELVMLERRS